MAIAMMMAILCAIGFSRAANRRTHNAAQCNPFPFIQFGKYNENVKSETISCTRNTNCIYYLVEVHAMFDLAPMPLNPVGFSLCFHSRTHFPLQYFNINKINGNSMELYGTSVFFHELYTFV